MKDSKQQDPKQRQADSRTYQEWNQILARQLAEWRRIEQERTRMHIRSR